MKAIDEVKQFVCEFLDLCINKESDYVHICKAYFYANLFAFKDIGALISVHTCARLPHGPVINDYEEIFQEMDQEGAIKRIGQYFQLRLIEKKKYAHLHPQLLKYIEQAFRQVDGKTPEQLSEETHQLESVKKAMMSQEIDFFDEVCDNNELNRVGAIASSLPRFQ